MRSAVCWLNFVGRPVGLGATGFFAGVVLPWACLVAFGVLAGFLDPLLVVSGITRNPHVNERMLSVYSIRFHFASSRFGHRYTNQGKPPCLTDTSDTRSEGVVGISR